MAKAKPRVLSIELTEQQFLAIAVAVDKCEIDYEDTLNSLDPSRKNDREFIDYWSDKKENLNDGWVSIRNAWHKAGGK